MSFIHLKMGLKSELLVGAEDGKYYSESRLEIKLFYWKRTAGSVTSSTEISQNRISSEITCPWSSLHVKHLAYVLG